MLHIFEGEEAVIKMINKGLRRKRHVSRPIGLHLIGYLTEPTRTPRIQIKYVDTKNQLEDIVTKAISHVMSETIFSICSISAARNNIEKNAGRNRRRKNYGKVKTDDEHGFEDCCKIFNGAKLECIELPGDTQRTWSKLESYRSCAETCRQRFESK